MSPFAISLVTLFAAIGSGVVAGIFFAFSTFVMPALARLPAEQGIAAMQAINVAAPNRWFMGMMFGTAAAGLHPKLRHRASLLSARPEDGTPAHRARS